MGQDNSIFGGRQGRSLGLNLGLQPQGRAAFRQAAGAGDLTGFLQQHPHMAARLGRQMQGSPDIAQLAQQFFAPSQQPQAQGAPAGAAGQKGGGVPPPAQARPMGSTAPAGKQVPGSMPPPNQGGTGAPPPSQSGKPPKRPTNQGG